MNCEEELLNTLKATRISYERLRKQINEHTRTMKKFVKAIEKLTNATENMLKQRKNELQRTKRKRRQPRKQPYYVT